MDNFYLIIFLLIIILLTIFTIYIKYHSSWYKTEKEGLSNQTQLNVGNSLKQSEFIASPNTEYIFGLFGSTMGVYKIPKDTKIDSSTDNYGLTQELLRKSTVKVVTGLNGAYAIYLSVEGISVRRSDNTVLWSSVISRINSNTTLRLGNDGKITLSGIGVWNLNRIGTIVTSTLENKTIFEYILEQLSYEDEYIQSKLFEVYAIIDPVKLETFRSSFNNVFKFGEDFGGLQQYVYTNLNSAETSDVFMYILKNMINVFNCSKYRGRDAYLYNETGDQLGNKYNSVLDTYYNMTKDITQLQQIDNHIIDNISTFAPRIYQMDTMQRFLYMTGLEKVLYQITLDDKKCTHGQSIQDGVLESFSCIDQKYVEII